MLDDFTRAERRRYIGSSDAAALIGKDPWGRTAGDVWAEKTGRVVPNGRPSAAQEVGSFLEAAILNWTETQLDSGIIRDLFLTRSVLCANLDGAAPSARPPAIIEAKSAGLIARPHYLDEFGDAGSDEVPRHILVQVHHQLAVIEDSAELPPITVAYVPALLVGRGFVLYRIEKEQALCDVLVEEAERFWRDYVETDRPPPEAPSLQTLRYLRRPDEALKPLERGLVEAWIRAKDDAKATRIVEEEALRALLFALGDAEAGDAGPFGTFTYKAQTRAAYLVKETTFRVPRLVKPKKGSTHA